MATSTFDRKIVIADPESVAKLLELIADDAPKKTFSRHPYIAIERESSEELLRLCLSHSSA